MKRIRLTLRTSYTWPSRNPNKPNENNCGFIQTKKRLAVGDVVSFEDLKPTSNAGDLNEEHYKYFEKRIYKTTMHENGFLNLVEQ